MKIWILTDTHFGHRNMINYENRPQDFSSLILRNTKETIGKQGVLLFLGDFCIGNDEMWHQNFFGRLNPRVMGWMVLGNHDKKNLTWYLDHGWDMVCFSLELKIHGKHLRFTHEREETLPEGVINVHGHSHSKGESDENHISLAIEKMKYGPEELRNILGKHYREYLK